MATKKAPVFVREATGLVREAGAYDVFAFNGLSVTGPQMVPPWLLTVPIIASYALLGPTLLVSAIGGILIALLYYVLSVSMPRSGGDYVYGSRLLHPIAGIFAGTMTGVFAGVVLASWGATAWVPTGLVPLLAYFGSTMNNPGLMNMAAAATQPVYLGALAVVSVLGFTALLGLGGTKRYYIVQNVLVTLGIIGMVTLLGVLLMTDHNTFVTSLNEFLQPYNMNYNSLLSTAQTNNFVVPTSLSLLLILPAMVNIYGSTFWVQASGYLGGEIRHVKRSQLIGIIGSIVFWIIVCGSIFMLMINMAGYEFVSAHSYLLLNKPSALGTLPPVPQFLIYGLVAARNPFLAALIGIGIIAGTVPVVGWSLLIFSRSVFAMSFDRVLPSFFSEVNEKFHSPLKALVTCGLIALAFAVMNFLPQSAAFVTYFGAAQGFLYIITFIVIGFGAMLYPYLKKALYNDTCQFKKNIAGIPLISIIAAAVIIFNVIDGYYLMSLPQYYGVTPQFLGTLVIAIVFSIVLYPAAKAYRMRKGIDLSLAFKTLPPE
jgi:amino acid transporter